MYVGAVGGGDWKVFEITCPNVLGQRNSDSFVHCLNTLLSKILKLNFKIS